MRPYSPLLLAAIIMAVTAPAGSASAQEVTIETSADDHGSRFFGEGAVRVVIEDESTDDNA
jgi:hypothetical protein